MGQSHSYRPWQLWSDILLQNPSSPAARINKHLRTPHRVPLVLACSGQHSVWWTSSPQPTENTRTCLNLRMSATIPCRMVPNWRPTTPSTWPAARQKCAGTTNSTVSVYSWRRGPPPPPPPPPAPGPPPPPGGEPTPPPPRPAPGPPAAVQPAPCLRPHTLPANSQPAQEGPACQPPTAPTCRRRRCARRAAPLGRAPLLFLLLLGRS